VGDHEDRLSRVETLVAPVLEAHGLALVDADWRRQGRRWVLTLYVDKPGGVGLADCQRLSREVGDLLDAAGVIEASYDLEVSSPGLERELRKDREFQWAMGRQIRCWLREPREGRTEVVGRLVGVSPEALTLVGPGGDTEILPRGLLTRVRLVFEGRQAGRRA
jgi:ribosome maturation factor RimP